MLGKFLKRTKWTHKKTILALKAGRLPDDFDGWHIQYQGKSLPFLAAALDRLPADCGEAWYMKGKSGLMLVEAFMIAQNRLPDSPIDWTRITSNGDPLIFTAIRYAGVPKDFAEWDILNSSGESAFAYAAKTITTLETLRRPKI